MKSERRLDRVGITAFCLSLALWFLSCGVLLAFEGWAYFTGRRLVTNYVRDWGDDHPQLLTLALCAACALVAHFAWH